MSSEKYYSIHMERSDGQRYIASEQTETEPELLNDKDDRRTRWRVTLGSHVKYQLGDLTDKKLYILADFPDGYELREVKANVYLFGHPSGNRFRTAGEFVPHLLWLMSDSVDRNDCSCNLCMDLVKKETKQASASATPVPPPQRAQQAPPQQQQQVQQSQEIQQPQQFDYRHQTSQNAHQAQYQQPYQQQQPQPSHPASQYAQPLTTASTPSNMGISSPSNIFRAGEMVWYKDRAWRLGIILSVSPKTPNSHPTGDDYQYIFDLAPLGHVGLRKPNAAKEAAEMRPFLTFSVPDSPQYQGKSHSQIDWMAEAERLRTNPNPGKAQQDLEILGLEASKVAARTINNCFSVFNRQPDRAQTGAGFSQEFYSGVYLGAEMIVVGDAVRVTAPPKMMTGGPDGDEKFTTVMRVDDIVVLVAHGRGRAVNLQLRGTVYLLTRRPEHEIDAAEAAEHLGATFKEDVDFRNSLLAPEDRQQQQRWTWQPVERPAFRADDAIHGRFYVSHKLVAVLSPEKLREAVQNRAIQDAFSLLNTRQQNGGGLPYAGRMIDRRSCLGQSITVGALVLPAGVREEFPTGPAV